MDALSFNYSCELVIKRVKKKTFRVNFRDSFQLSIHFGDKIKVPLSLK